MEMSDIQLVYLILACSALFTLALIAGQILWKTGSVSVANRSSFVTAAAVVLAVRTASFYMAMGHAQQDYDTQSQMGGNTVPKSHDAGVVDAVGPAADYEGDVNLTSSASSSTRGSALFAAEWSLVLNLDWGGVCFLAACLTHVSSLLRAALAARTLDRYGVLKRVFQNQNGLHHSTRRQSSASHADHPISEPSVGSLNSVGLGAGGAGIRPPHSANTSGSPRGGTGQCTMGQRTSSGGFAMGAALDRGLSTDSVGAAALGGGFSAAAPPRLARAGSSAAMGPGGDNPYRPRRQDVRGNLLLPSASSLLLCCTPARIGASLGCTMAALVLSYFAVTLGFFFAVADRSRFENTVIPMYFAAWFFVCALGLAVACYLHADSGALVLWHPEPAGHCRCPMLGCKGRSRRTPYAADGYIFMDDISRHRPSFDGGDWDKPGRPRFLSMDSIMKRTGWCGVLKGYPLTHRSRATLWAAALLVLYTLTRGAVTLLASIHEAGSLTRNDAVTAAVYFGSEILVIFLVTQVLMPALSGGTFDTTDAEFVLALFRNMRLRKNVVADVADVFSDVPAVMRTVSKLPQEDVSRLYVSLQRNMLRQVGMLTSQLRVMEEKSEAQHSATIGVLQSEAVASNQRAGEIMDALAAQQEEFREWSEDQAVGALEQGGLKSRLMGGFAGSNDSLAALEQFAGGDLRVGGGYAPPALVSAHGHSYSMGPGALATIESPSISLDSGAFPVGGRQSTGSSSSGSGGGGTGGARGFSLPTRASNAMQGRDDFTSPGAVGAALAGRGHPGSTDGLMLSTRGVLHDARDTPPKSTQAQKDALHLQQHGSDSPGPGPSRSSPESVEDSKREPRRSGLPE